MTTETMQEVLSDINVRGRDRPWRRYKVANEYIAMAYDDINPDKAARLRSCANMLEFDVDLFGRKHLASAWFCRVRLCPMCTWRRTLKVGSQMRDILANIAASDRPLSYIMLTLTVRNCVADKLGETIDALMQGVNRLNRQLPFVRAVRGWYRGMEVTHNLERSSDFYDTYHPHMHMILGVLPSYFKGADYISQERWGQMWQQAMRTDYTPRVDVRRVKGDTAAAVAEAAKYTVKPEDIIVPDDWELTVDTVRILDAALHNRRLVAFGGRLKEVHRLLELDDAEDGDLIRTDGKDSGGEGWKKVCYAWYTGYRQYRRDTQ